MAWQNPQLDTANVTGSPEHTGNTGAFSDATSGHSPVLNEQARSSAFLHYQRHSRSSDANFVGEGTYQAPQEANEAMQAFVLPALADDESQSLPRIGSTALLKGKFLEIQGYSPFSLDRPELHKQADMQSTGLPAARLENAPLEQIAAPAPLTTSGGISSPLRDSTETITTKTYDPASEIAHAAWGMNEIEPAPAIGNRSLASVTAGLNRIPRSGSPEMQRRAAVELSGARTLKTADALQPNISSKAAEYQQPVQPTRAARVADVLQPARVVLQVPIAKEVSRPCSANVPILDVEAARSKFQGDGVAFSTTISPTGERQNTHVAADFSSMTETWTPGMNGLFSYKEVHRDSFNRVLCEVSVDETGKSEIIQTHYQDRDGHRSPFVACKVRVGPDGSQQFV